MHLLLVNYSRIFSIKMKMGLVTEDDFIGKICIFMFSLQYPINELPSLSMVSWLQFLSQLNFVCMKMQIIRQNSLQSGFGDTNLLSSVSN